MSRAARLLVIVAAWAVPTAWIAAALSSGPSDGTSVSPSAGLAAVTRWGETVTVVHAYGDTPLRPGDIIRSIDSRAWGDWLTLSAAPDRGVGDTLTYRVRRPAADLDRLLLLDVTLTRYPVTDALRASVAGLTLSVLGLAAGSLLLWRRPSSGSCRAALAAAALLPCGLTASSLGLAAVDVAGGRGLWPQVGGGLLVMAGLACALVAAVVLVPARTRPRWAWIAPVAPLAGYAAWLGLEVLPRPAGPSEVQGLVTLTEPASAATVPAGAAVLLAAHLRTDRRPDRLATRLVLLALVGALGVRLLLGDLPARLVGQPLVPLDLLTVACTAVALGCVVSALLHYRLEVVEPTVRRTLAQALVLAVAGAAFLTAVGAVDRASDRSFESMLAGGVIALLVLPLALALRRGLRRLLEGQRDLPRRVVAELRRLDPTAAPEETLRESLALLADVLRLSWAAIEVDGRGTDPGLTASVGEQQGTPTTVELVAGGTRLGRLLLETDPGRDPFGAGDRALLEDVGAQVGALVQAVLMSSELHRSRQHLVTAREEERRRLRRDLHDGLGPSLATMAMQLETARDLIGRDPRSAADLVDRLSDAARDEIAEVRRLVDGLRPPALDQLGLVSALRQRAQEHAAGSAGPDGRSRLRWRVETDGDVEPLPAAVEVAAYLIALEAVTNAWRHSGAEQCVVRLARQGDRLVVRVSDTGRGLAATPGVGVGLTSMRERAEELGGTCTVTADGTGTTVEAVLPVAEAGAQ